MVPLLLLHDALKLIGVLVRAVVSDSVKHAFRTGAVMPTVCEDVAVALFASLAVRVTR